ncbi:hypothetical protein [Desulfurococcus amylolyticus]|uniref:hypothetical protein n=1 Tax=Desulfurococcus TaxID=2273 RepID=UPI0023F0E04D|nr:hypothetical protein [Desulfurococcus amylolyticus]
MLSRGLARGLMLVGLTGLMLSAALFMVYYVLLTYLFTSYPGVFSVTGGVLAGLLVLFLARYFLHVAVDAFHVLYLSWKKVLRGLDTCG